MRFGPDATTAHPASNALADKLSGTELFKNTAEIGEGQACADWLLVAEIGR
jgi:hypothetical protein